VSVKNELREDWLAAAQVRAKQLDDGTAQAVPGDDVIRRARALIKPSSESAQSAGGME
jgi:hypothetical protein